MRLLPVKRQDVRLIRLAIRQSIKGGRIARAGLLMLAACGELMLPAPKGGRVADRRSEPRPLVGAAHVYFGRRSGDRP